MVKQQDLSSRLQNHLQAIVRERHPYLNSAGHFFVKQYIYRELEKWGKVEVHIPSDFGLASILHPFPFPQELVAVRK